MAGQHSTRSQFDASDWITTKDKVFLFSEADLFGTFNDIATSDARDYTYGVEQLVPEINMRKSSTALASLNWLRSPLSNTACTASLRGSGVSVSGYGSADANNGVRPAMWVRIS